MEDEEKRENKDKNEVEIEKVENDGMKNVRMVIMKDLEEKGFVL